MSVRYLGTATLERGEGRWAISAEPDVMIRLKRVFGRVAAYSVGTVHLSDTEENCRDLLWFADRYPLEFSPADEAYIRRAAETRRDVIARVADLIDAAYEPPAFALAEPARGYQRRAAAVLLAQGHLLLGDDVGLGKTVSAIAALTDPRTLPAVVVTKTILPPQWVREIKRFAPSLTTHIVTKGQPYALPTFFGRGPDVVLLNYHKLAGWAQVLGAYARTVIYDEIQELRHDGTAKYSGARHLAALPFRIGLSATPIYNYGGEIFNVLSALKPGCLGSRDEFLREWCTGFADKPRIRDAKAFGFYLRRSGLMLRRTREEVGRELPEVTRVPQEIDADMAALDKVEDSVAELARIIVGRDSTRTERFHAGGQLDAMMRQATGVAKAPAVAEFVKLIAESGERVVLCGWHREVYSIWGSALRDLNPVFITGAESATQKQASLAAFIEGKSQVLVLSLRAGEGIDGLQGVCNVIVFGELDWAEGVHIQCIGRIHRDGQGQPVTAYFCVSNAGCDPIMAQVLGLKREQLAGINDPTADIVQRLDTGGAHIRALAEAALARRGKTATSISEAA